MYRDFGTPDVLKTEGNSLNRRRPTTRFLSPCASAAVNTFPDWYMVRGKPAFFRLLLGSGKKPLGVDLAGEVSRGGRPERQHVSNQATGVRNGT